MLRGPMLFLWFDHPLIEAWLEAWLEACLRPQLHREDPPQANDRPLQGLQIPVIESLPDVARESIERASVHVLHANTPRRHNDRRRW